MQRYAYRFRFCQPEWISENDYNYVACNAPNLVHPYDAYINMYNSEVLCVTGYPLTN